MFIRPSTYLTQVLIAFAFPVMLVLAGILMCLCTCLTSFSSQNKKPAAIQLLNNYSTKFYQTCHSIYKHLTIHSKILKTSKRARRMRSRRCHSRTYAFMTFMAASYHVKAAPTGLNHAMSQAAQDYRQRRRENARQLQQAMEDALKPVEEIPVPPMVGLEFPPLV